MTTTRAYSRRLVSTWRDKDFRSLSLEQQGLYDALCSSPDLNRCGVLNWIPSRLIECCDGLNERRLRRLVDDLVARDYLRLDASAGELMVRSHIRIDEVLRTPNITLAMARAYKRIHSPYIQECVVRELARLMGENPNLPGWKAVRDENPDLHAEVMGHPLAEGNLELFGETL